MTFKFTEETKCDKSQSEYGTPQVGKIKMV